MKPTFQTIERSSRRDSIARRKGSPAPQVECFFQSDAPSFSGYRHNNDGVPPFRGISAAYFDREARSHFQVEAIVFGLIVLSAAVPVIQGLRGVAHIVSGVL
jgi:hypothetical protein